LEKSCEYWHWALVHFQAVPDGPEGN